MKKKKIEEKCFIVATLLLLRVLGTDQTNSRSNGRNPLDMNNNKPESISKSLIGYLMASLFNEVFSVDSPGFKNVL